MWTVRGRTLCMRPVRLRAVGTRAIRMLTLGTRAARMHPIVSGSLTLRRAGLPSSPVMLAMPHVPFLPTIVRSLAAVRSFLIGRGYRRRRSPAHLMGIFFCPATPMSVVFSLRHDVKHPEPMRVLASQARLIQERQQLGISSQLETSCIAMHGRVLERNDRKMRRMVETADAEPIAGGFLLCPGVVLADGIVQDKLGEQRVVGRKVVCGVAVLALALVHGDGADGPNSPCDQPVSGDGNRVGSDKPLHVGVVSLRQNELVESALYFDPDTHRNLHSIQRTDNRKGEPLWP